MTQISLPVGPISAVFLLQPAVKLSSVVVKVHRLAKFYPNEFSSSNLFRLDLQLETCIVDMRKYEMFKNLNNCVDLLVKFVETKRDKVYCWVYLLIKLVLLLLVTSVNVKSIFSTMTFIKNRLTNKMGDNLLDYCLVVLLSGILPYN